MPEMSDFQKSMVPIDHLFRRKKEKNDQPERILQRKICDHLQTFYPDVYFMSDPSGIKLSPNILKLLKATRSRHNQLDLVILEPFTILPNERYSGLILEIKAKSPFKKTGELLSDEHLSDQFDVMCLLKEKGFFCRFVWELEHTIEIIEFCLGKPVANNEPLFP